MSGRGGAGNVNDTRNLEPKPSDPADLSSSPQRNSISNPGHYGRGGAGNYASSEPSSNQPQERELQEMPKHDIFASTKSALREPEKAHLSGTNL